MIRILFFLLLIPYLALGQSLIDTPEGDEINLPSKIFDVNHQLLVKVNSSTESIETKYIYLKNKKNESDPIYGDKVPDGAEPLIKKYFPIIFGFKIKPVDGIGNIYTKGDFQGAMVFNLQLGDFWIPKKTIFKNQGLFANLSISYSAERLTMLYPDRPFSGQIDKSYFKGLSSLGQFSLLLKGKHYISISTGYARKNNYQNLDKITINDFTIIEEGDISREYGTQENGRIGSFKKYDRYPVRLSYTILPSELEERQKLLGLGFTGYYSCDFGNIAPMHNICLIAFVTKQDKDSGIRIPSLGVGLLAKDVTDNLDKNDAFEKHLNLNISATINLL
jgi:hypothetical protein